MKTFLFTRAMAAALGLLLLQWITPVFAQGISVERVQREFQARYAGVNNGERVAWPKYSESSSPSPHFPKDGYYGKLNENSDKAVELVKDLVQKFYTSAPIYGSFVSVDNLSELEGVSSITLLQSSDLPTISVNDVTSDNWVSILSTVSEQIFRLKFVKINGEQVITGGDSRLSAVDFASDDFSCGDRQACLISIHSALGWGNTPSDIDECELIDEVPNPFFSYTSIGRTIETGFTAGEALDPDDYFVSIRNTRGRIRADLSAFAGGSAFIFLKLDKPSCDFAFWHTYSGELGTCSSHYSTFSSSEPVSSGEGTYGLWADGILTLGSVSTTSEYVTGSEDPPTAIGSCIEGVASIYGWEVAEAVAIVAPDFTKTPDLDLGGCCGDAGCEPGSLTANLQSIHINIPLGGDDYGSSAGTLSLSAELPSPALAKLSALRYTKASNVAVIPASNPTTRWQFKTSQALFDIQENTAYKYTISIYNAANSGTISGTFYQPTGPASSTIAVENPDGASAHNRLKVTRTKGGSSEISEYTYTAGQWELLTGGGMRKETRAAVWTSATEREETVTVRDSANQIVYKEVNTYTRFPWGQERTMQVVDPDGAELTSTWTFYTNPAEVGRYSYLKEQTGPYGHWVQYYYDSYGREEKRVAQYLNSSVGSADNLNRVVTTDYDTLSPQITTVETLLGKEVARRYQIVQSGEVRDIVCQTAGALYTASDNLTTITKRFTSEDFKKGELQSVEHPDGTMQIYSYSISGGTRTDTVESGQPNGGKTAIVDGTRTVTVKGGVGQMVSRTITDIASSKALFTENYSNYDEFNRPQRVTYLDGTYSDTYYACCGVDTTTDRDGVVTQHLYDGLKRQDGYVRHGITFRNTLDAEGRVRVQKRIGTDSSEIILAQTTYDIAGRVSTEINGLNGTTSYVETFNGSGQRVRTVTFPDTGTRIETYNKDGTLEKVTGTAVFGVRFDYGVEQDGVSGPWRAYTKETRLDGSGNPTSEWTKNYNDLVGRNYKTIFADNTTGSETDNPYSQVFYNNAGQLSKQRDPDAVVTLYQYNVKGELEYTALDLDADSTIDLGGPDRVIHTIADVTASYGADVDRQRDEVYPTDASSTPLQVSKSETSTDGLRTWQTVYRDASTPVLTQTQTVYNNNDGVTAAGYRTVTVTYSHSSKTVSVHYQGRLLSVTRKTASLGQVTKTTYTYDTHGRLWKTTDARNGTTVFTYNNADQIVTMTTPLPGTGGAVQTTTTHYNTSLRAWKVTQSDNTDVLNDYYLTGMLKKTYGTRNYPVEYTYDYAGRLKTMTTWKDFNESTGQGTSGSAVTTWNYNAYRGWLDNKRTADNNGPDYSYTAAGRIKTRTWARTGTSSQRIVTTYTYGFENDGISDNQHGDLVGVAYSNDPQNTPGMTLTYDRRGRQKTVLHNGTTTTLSYNDANQLQSESHSGGTLGGLTVTSGYDTHLRRNTLSVNTPSAISMSYGYDIASRLLTVTHGNYNATYSYLADSPLVEQITFKESTTTRMTTAKQYDFLNRLTSVSSVNSIGYAYNDANQRFRTTLSDGSYWFYEYDSLGQVKSGRKYWADGNPVAGQQFEYAYDDIGNRTQTKAGGDENGLNPRSASYTPNALNQYSSRDVPGAVDVMGIAMATASVTVNSQSPYRKGEYFRKELTVANGSAPVWQSVAVAATSETTVNGNVFVPKTPEAFTPDLDGNLLTDGRWNYTWDAENRLRQVESLGSAPTASKRKVVWEYDYAGRRIRQITSDGSSGSYVVTEDLKFVSDGWQQIAELNAANNAVVRSYVWGLDLSGSIGGVGGVGGLLMLNSVANGVHFYAYDGNGNVVTLVKGTDGTVSARYEYGPFGELLRNTGSMANENRFQFSTKRSDKTTDLVLYEYRAFSPALGRWLSGDTIEEAGGINLYGFARNDGLNMFDYLGREGVTTFRFASGQTKIIIGHQGVGVNTRDPVAIFTDTADAGKTVVMIPGAKPPQAKPETAAEKIVTLIIPNPAETVRQADASFATAANPNIPKYLRVSAFIAGTSIIILGVVEFVPGAGAGTKPLKRECVTLAGEKIDDALQKEILRILKERERQLAAKGTDKFVDLTSPARRSHILDGEVRPNGTFGGGHRPGTGFPGKSEFPAGWSDDKIMLHISDVATDPLSTVRAGSNPADIFMKSTREGVDIEVLIRNGEIWTGYPTSVPRNP